MSQSRSIASAPIFVTQVSLYTLARSMGSVVQFRDAHCLGYLFDGYIYFSACGCVVGSSSMVFRVAV